MKINRSVLASVGLLAASTVFFVAAPVSAGEITLEPTSITEWKAVYGQIEARNTVPARARIGGTVVELKVTEGDEVKAGDVIATVQDDKIAFQVAALDAQLRAQQAQLDTAQADLDRGEPLVKQGILTKQRLDQLQTQVDVARNQIAATEAQRDVINQQAAEGAVLAPADGKVLTVPVTRGAVIMPGEPVATIGSGGLFLRLAIPERHAETLKPDAEIHISAGGEKLIGRMAKIYPQIENGRVIADVDVDALDTRYVNARVLVDVPIGHREALVVPAASLGSRHGLYFVRTATGDGEIDRAVILGQHMDVDGVDSVEVLTGLNVGDKVLVK